MIGTWLGQLGQCDGEAHGTRTTGRLQPVDQVAGVGVGPEDDRHTGLYEALVTLGPQIAFAVLLIEQAAFAALHRFEHRGRAIIGAVHADAEVDLVCTLIGGELRDQREQRVGRSVLQAIEHARPMLSHAHDRNRFYRRGAA